MQGVTEIFFFLFFSFRFFFFLYILSRTVPNVPFSPGGVAGRGSPKLIDGDAVFWDVGEVQGLVPAGAQRELLKTITN